MKFTPSQQNAIDARGRSLLVSAAAGSGKTFTLTQRIIKAIIEEERDLSRMLIVTFTRAAASELKAKISKALSSAIAEHPENSHLQNQLIKLGSANISTIDSFFSAPIRTNFEKLGLPASMRLSDEAELSPLREQTMNETLGVYFDKCGAFHDETLSPVGQRSNYTDLLNIISAARDNSNISPTLIDIYRKLITSPKGVGQLKDHALRMKESSQKDFFETEEGKAVRSNALDAVKNVIASFEKCCKDMADEDLAFSKKYIPCFEDNKTLCIALYEKIKKQSYVDAKEAIFAYKADRISSLKKEEQCAESEYYKNLRGKKLNPAISDIKKKLFFSTQEEISTVFLTNAELCSLLFDILSEFERRYTEEKLRRGICEFSDMPKYMLSLLTDSNGQPSEYANALAESFDEVYIDEYQDVNEIQDRIFELIGRDHRFMVGDIKQSIYGFREAEPSIFAGYRAGFSPYGEDDTESPGNSIFMSNNFRCDENVIKFTNTVCSRIFSTFSESIGYTSDDDLIFTKEKPYNEYSSPEVVIDLVQSIESENDEDDDSFDDGDHENTNKLNDEAYVVANEIARLVRHEKGADGMPLRFGDIAVLVRSHSHAKPLIQALDKLNIKHVSSSKGDIFDDPEMSFLADLLRVIDNPRSDIPLCRLLTAKTQSISPLFTLEEIVTVRRHTPRSKSLFDAMILYDGESTDENIVRKCREFVLMIDKMRTLSAKVSADKLLRAIASHDKFSSLLDSRAYIYIYDCACKYVRNSWNGLYSFVKHLNSLMEKGESGLEPAKADRDTVTVMTVHQSKGLEFNTCFLFGFNKQFNFSDSRSPMIFTKEFGLSMKLPPSAADDDPIESMRKRYEENILWRAAEIKTRQKLVEEEARIFYVALTRARERLYISATLNKSYHEYMNTIEKDADKTYGIKRSKTYMKWILTALSETDDNSSYKINIHDVGQISLTQRFDSSRSLEGATNILPEEKEYAELFYLTERIGDEEKILSVIPSKVAASKVSPKMLDDSVFLPIPTGKLFSEEHEDINEQCRDSNKNIKNRIDIMRSQRVNFDDLLEVNQKPTAAEKGTATHLFLQFCDYKNIEENGVDAEIERLRIHRFITERTASIIDRKQLSGFFKSALYSYISSAKNIRREFKFGMFRSAADFTADKKLGDLIADKKIFIQGSIDLIIENENGEILVCDYKTDRISSEERSDPLLLMKNMKEKHGEQLSQYSYAIERIFNKKPSKTFIYSVPLGEMIEIK